MTRTPVPTSVVAYRTGGAPYAVAVPPSSRFVYVANQTDGTLSGSR